MAEEVRPLNVVGDDGAGGRAAETPLLSVGQYGRDIENRRDEITCISNEFGPGAGCSSAIAAL